ncbi:MAG TPA: recombinase RecT [Bryobacteraceae bacterium]|nr:recombinase RecT [Bryobacteraceae bacterium]
MGAVATVPQDNKAVAKVPLGDLQKLLEAHKDQISMALPRHMTPERMIRVAMTAYSTTPALWECDVKSIAACIVQSSILGLEPNSVLGESYLIPFRNKGKMTCQLIVGYQGLLKLVRNSGELMMVNAQVVHARDDFDFEYGLEPFLRHKKAAGTPADRGPVVAYWAGAVLKGGGKQFVVMSRPEVEAHRDKYSKAKDFGPWKTEFDEMAKKTCIRKLAKLLPKSIEKDFVSAAVNLDERAEAGLAQRFSIDVPLALQSPVDEDPSAEVEMPKRASEVAAEAETDQPKRTKKTDADVASDAEAQRKARAERLAALADLVAFPDPMEHPIGGIIRVKGALYITNLDRSAWEPYKEPAE